MIATTHLITGAVVGALCPNWWLAAILAILLHYLLDAVPHKDFDDDKGFQINAPIIADGVFGLLIIFLFYFFGKHNFNLVWGAFFGLLPDMFAVAMMIFTPKIWASNWHTRFMRTLHWFDYSRFKLKNPPSVRVSVAYQVVIWVVCFLILFLNHTL